MSGNFTVGNRNKTSHHFGNPSHINTNIKVLGSSEYYETTIIK